MKSKVHSSSKFFIGRGCVFGSAFVITRGKALNLEIDSVKLSLEEIG